MISVVPGTGTGTGAAESLSSLNRSTCRERTCSCMFLFDPVLKRALSSHVHLCCSLSMDLFAYRQTSEELAAPSWACSRNR